MNLQHKRKLGTQWNASRISLGKQHAGAAKFNHTRSMDCIFHPTVRRKRRGSVPLEACAHFVTRMQFKEEPRQIPSRASSIRHIRPFHFSRFFVSGMFTRLTALLMTGRTKLKTVFTCDECTRMKASCLNQYIDPYYHCTAF